MLALESLKGGELAAAQVNKQLVAAHSVLSEAVLASRGQGSSLLFASSSSADANCHSLELAEGRLGEPDWFLLLALALARG